MGRVSRRSGRMEALLTLPVCTAGTTSQAPPLHDGRKPCRPTSNWHEAMMPIVHQQPAQQGRHAEPGWRTLPRQAAAHPRPQKHARLLTCWAPPRRGRWRCWQWRGIGRTQRVRKRRAPRRPHGQRWTRVWRRWGRCWSLCVSPREGERVLWSPGPPALLAMPIPHGKGWRWQAPQPQRLLDLARRQCSCFPEAPGFLNANWRLEGWVEWVGPRKFPVAHPPKTGLVTPSARAPLTLVTPSARAPLGNKTKPPAVTGEAALHSRDALTGPVEEQEQRADHAQQGRTHWASRGTGTACRSWTGCRVCRSCCF